MHGSRRKFLISTAEVAIRGRFFTNHSLGPSSGTLLLSPPIPAFSHPLLRPKRGRGKGEELFHDYSTEPQSKTPTTRKEIRS